MDSYLVALGQSGAAHALDVILEKAHTLTSKHASSHFRAISLAMEQFKDPRAAKVLAALLEQPKFQGYALDSMEKAAAIRSQHEEMTYRERALRELVLARALYRCGDHQGLGKKILVQYTRDLRGLYARHAEAILGN